MSRALVSRDVFQLANVPGGLRPGTVSFKTVTLESDKYVAVRDMQPDNSTSVVLADLTRGVADRHNFKEPAESVLMHPVARVLALRFGTTLQIYKVDERTKVKESQFVDGAIVYWRWANATTLALVTDTAVYHWSADPSNAAPPQKIFDRAAGMGAEVQVLSYRVDAANKWFMLCGVARTDAGLLGKTQLFTAESNASRVIDGHTGCFAVVKGPNDPRDCTVMCVAWSVAGQGGRLLIMELPNSSKPDITLERRNVNIPIDTPGDFPVAAHVSPRHKLLTVVTSRGSAILVDVLTGTVVSSEQVTQNVIFMGAPYEKTGGLLCVTNTGSLTHVSVDDDGICRYISSTLHNPDLAVRVASDAGLAGADDLFRTQLLNAVQRGDANAAIEAARASPRGSLRTAETLRLIQNMPAAPGQPPAISAYFKTMLAAGKLNVAESEELARVIIPKPNGYVYVKQQLDEDKLEVSETLADLVAPQDADAALRMYHKVKAHAKVVNVLLGRNEVQNAVEYCRRAEYTPDWRVVLQNLIRVNPMDATNLALMLHNDLAPQPVLDPIEVADMFVAAGQSETNVRAASKFIIDVLQGSRVGVAGPGLQTKLLEINLKFSRPEVAERIFSLPFMTQFDRAAIAPLCERANLWQAALDGYNTIQIESHYERSTMTNIKRCLAAGAASVPVEWLAEFFGRLRRDDSIDALRELMKNSKGNFKAIVQIAVKYNDSLGSNNLINLLLETHAYDVMYYYLSSIITYVRDPEVHFRYIEAATEIGQLADVERMTRESPCYDPERTKNYLKEKNLDDLWPFVNVCDKHDYIAEMVKFLIDKNQAHFLEQYVQRRSPQKTPQVIGALIDLDAGEHLIKTVLTAAGSMVPVDELVKEVESRGRLRSLQQWLEQRAGERRTEPALHTALAKIYVDAADHTAENFLKQNSYYDARVVGEYCETRDPALAFIAYEKGQCSSELVAVGKRNGMWRQLAKYLVKARDEASWAAVLQDVSTGPLSPQFVEAVRSETAQSDVAEEVITTVRAFMAADMMPELTVILDQVVTSGRFQRNKYLENLLLTSAIKSRPEKVGEYLNKLQDYDPKDIAPTAVQAGLFDAAFTIYHKAGMKREAIGVLLEHMHDVSRARAYAQDAKDSGVFSVLGRYLLSKDELAEAIEALIEARNPEYVAEAMAAADRANQYGDLIKYLQMARRERKAGAAADLNIDTYLVLTFAKTGRMAELEEFLKGTTHNVQVVQVADKCFADGLYDSARALYTAASNFPKLASTYVRLRNFPAAVEAATKAQKAYTWKDVMVGCVLAEELALAQTCAVPLTLQPDELPFVVNLYEEGGYLTELFALLKHSMVQQNAHKSVFTECAVLYAKYKPDLLMEHIKLYAKKLNAHVVVNACVQHRHWLALRVLHIASEDWLAAAQTMLEHPAEAWEHELFKETISKMGNSDVCYNAIGFYLQHAPSKLHDFLTTVAKRIDTERVMTEVRRFAQLTFVRKFLESTQDRNVRRVNDALNSMYVEEEDFAALRRSVDSFNNFDSAELSARLEKLELFEFRKIALLLHRRNKRFSHAVEVAKANNLFQEAIDAAAESRDAELVEKLLRWFVIDKKRADCLAACLYVCYDLVPQHVVLELAWQYGMLDAAMPYLVQSSQELTERVAAIEKAMHDAQKHAKEAASHAATVAQHGGHAPLMITGGAAPGNMF